MISLDCETTGVDFRHGAAPFFVTTCREEGGVLSDPDYWEWPVDPLTRKPLIPPGDLEEIVALIHGGDRLVLQNAKFDITALSVLDPTIGDSWPWEDTDDTVLLAHLLASNQPKTLDALALMYLGADIRKFEDATQVLVNEARRIARARFPDWAIAKKFRPDMPSAKEKTWKFDLWLPRAVARELGYPDHHPYWTVTSDYALADSGVTAALFPVMIEECRRRGYEPHYRERLKALPVAFKMEARGVSGSKTRLEKLRADFSEQSREAGESCVAIARSFDYPLELPKSGNNHSLLHFCFGQPQEGHSNLFPKVIPYLDLPVIKRTDTGNPSLDQETLEGYIDTLPRTSKQYLFVKRLYEKRKADTALGYMESYERYWVPLDIWNEKGEQLWYLLHPSLNQTGTATLRWSSSNPNEQNISKKPGFNLRYIFGPAPGREWWSADAKNIELRIPAYVSGEQELIALFEKPNDPPYYGSNHLLIFHILHPEKWSRVEKEVGFLKVGPECKKRFAGDWYQRVKNGNFAVQYGAVDRDDGLGTADRTYGIPGAQARIKTRFAKQEALNQECIRTANRLGYIETLPDRTVDPEKGYPLLCTRTEYGRVKPTVPLNYFVQGTAMHWMQGAMIRCQAQLDEWNSKLFAPDYFMVMQVHDELVFDFPKRAHPKKDPKRSNLAKIRALQKLMEVGGDYLIPRIPTPVNIEFHEDNWSEGVTI